eukprot:487449-Amorphochlora_amoeboformis.AAC.2
MPKLAVILSSSSGRSKIKKGKEASPLGSDGPRGQTQAVGRHVTEEEMQHIIREMERAIQANYEAGMSGKARPSPKPMDDKLDKVPCLNCTVVISL